jgi:hypothetical protein
MPKRSRSDDDDIDELTDMFGKKTRMNLRRNPARSSRKAADDKRKQLEEEQEMKRMKRRQAKQLEEDADEMIGDFSNMSMRIRSRGGKRSKRSTKRTKRSTKRTKRSKRTKRTRKSSRKPKLGSCRRQTGSKYTNRPSPPYDANECKWRYMKGNDKRNWQSVPISKSVRYPGTTSDFKWVARQRK